MRIQEIENKLNSNINKEELLSIAKYMLEQLKNDYVEVESLQYDNVYYRFYNDGREEKVVY